MSWGPATVFIHERVSTLDTPPVVPNTSQSEQSRAHALCVEDNDVSEKQASKTPGSNVTSETASVVLKANVSTGEDSLLRSLINLHDATAHVRAAAQPPPQSFDPSIEHDTSPSPQPIAIPTTSSSCADADYDAVGKIVTGLGVLQGAVTELGTPPTSDLFDIVGEVGWKIDSSTVHSADLDIVVDGMRGIRDIPTNAGTGLNSGANMSGNNEVVNDNENAREGGEFDYDFGEEDNNTCNEHVQYDDTSASPLISNPYPYSQNMILPPELGGTISRYTPSNNGWMGFPTSWNDALVNFNSLLDLSIAMGEREGEWEGAGVLHETHADDEDVSWFFGADFHPVRDADTDDWVVDITLSDSLL